MSGKIKLFRLSAFLSLLAIALLLPISANKANATVPGDNGKIVFQSDRDGDLDIFSMDADGSNQTQLTFNTASDSTASWSPDGTKILLASTRDGGQSEIYIMDANGSNPVRLTNNAAIDSVPRWAPDGSKIVFTSARDGNDEIYTMDSDGTNQERLTNNTASDSFADWSPDSSKIIYYSNRDAGNNDIYIMDADGSNQTRLTSHVAVDGDPTWAPDASKIVFVSTRNGSADIYTMDPDGTNETRITTDGAADTSPAWSPDGTKVVFTTSRNGNNEIYIMNPDGTNQTRLTTNTASDTLPNWQGFNTPPDIGADNVTTPSGVPLTIGVLDNDSDANGLNMASFVVQSQPSHGTATIQSGEILYTPTNGYTGPDSFTYQICDRGFVVECSVGTVNIEVGSQNVAQQDPANNAEPKAPNTGAGLVSGNVYAHVLVATGLGLAMMTYILTKTKRWRR